MTYTQTINYYHYDGNCYTKTIVSDTQLDYDTMQSKTIEWVNTSWQVLTERKPTVYDYRIGWFERLITGTKEKFIPLFEI